MLAASMLRWYALSLHQVDACYSISLGPVHVQHKPPDAAFDILTGALTLKLGIDCVVSLCARREAVCMRVGCSGCDVQTCLRAGNNFYIFLSTVIGYITTFAHDAASNGGRPAAMCQLLVDDASTSFPDLNAAPAGHKIIGTCNIDAPAG